MQRNAPKGYGGKDNRYIYFGFCSELEGTTTFYSHYIKRRILINGYFSFTDNKTDRKQNLSKKILHCIEFDAFFPSKASTEMQYQIFIFVCDARIIFWCLKSPVRFAKKVFVRYSIWTRKQPFSSLTSLHKQEKMGTLPVLLM